MIILANSKTPKKFFCHIVYQISHSSKGCQKNSIRFTFYLIYNTGFIDMKIEIVWQADWLLTAGKM